MKTNKFMTMAAVLALSTTVAFAAPHEGNGGRHGRGGRAEFGPRFAQKLGLTDAQKEQISSIRQSFREQNKAFFESSKSTFQEFRAAKKAGDTAKVESLKPQLEAARTQMKQLHEQQRTQILAILTPEQRAQYEAMKAERQARREQRGNRRGGGKL
ncbi:MAG TPA: Spy/CpxP family protein refolding chaperone [Thermoanaerobaculia bacterium]|nr:Spy/CpxP family protein refolding chaperone [Thermoanaerobaculia bacterium]